MPVSFEALAKEQSLRCRINLFLNDTFMKMSSAHLFGVLLERRVNLSVEFVENVTRIRPLWPSSKFISFEILNSIKDKNL